MFIRIRHLYLTVLLLLLGWPCFSQEDIRFNHLTIEDGLPNSNINCMLQDSSGFIWIGTGAGLSKHDGNTIVTFVHNENDSSSISNSSIKCIYEDNLHNLWVGTSFGLSRFNPVKRNFTIIISTSGRLTSGK